MFSMMQAIGFASTQVTRTQLSRLRLFKHAVVFVDVMLLGIAASIYEI
jgi:hypothetical protein